MRRRAQPEQQLAPAAGATGRPWWLLVCALAATGAAGCEDMENGPIVCNRPATADPVVYRGGAVEGGVYMSADWDGELLHFPGGAYYEIHHELGEIPRWWQVYLSFERDGLGSGSIAEASGNQAELKAIDEHSITILNGSCSEYWMLAVVGSGDVP